MEDYYNEYTYKINNDFSINLLNRYYKINDILDPEIIINEHSKSISFDFGWHIFELNYQCSTYLTIAVKKNVIGINAFLDDDELPFSITDKDEVFIGLFNLNSEYLSFIPLEKSEKFLILNRGKICLPLANNNLEYFGSPVNETKNEHYRIRILLSQNSDKGGILIQKGVEGFSDNILSPMLNQINLNNPAHSEIFMVQNNYNFNYKNLDENEETQNNHNIEKSIDASLANNVATNNINKVIDFFNKNIELKENIPLKRKIPNNFFILFSLISVVYFIILLFLIL